MSAPIGIFDSGLGGLSVWKEVVKLLPGRCIVYVSDNGYCPYGPRPAEEVVERTKTISRFLIREGCAVVVVACNTATAAAIDILRNTFPVPFVGMEPAVKPAALHSHTGVVGVLATHGTFRGRLYQETSQRFASHVHIMEQVGDGLVELIEKGVADAPETLRLLRTYIEPMMEAGADHLVLGCTHYPFLIPAIQQIVQGRMTIIDPAPAVAQHLCTLLTATDPAPAVAQHLCTLLTATDLQATGPDPSSVSAHTPLVYRFFATGSAATLEVCYRSISPPSIPAQFNSYVVL